MASTQAEAPVEEVTEVQPEKSTQETPVIEEKAAPSEEAEVVVREADGDKDDEEGEGDKPDQEDAENEVKEDEDEKFGESAILNEPTPTFDDEAEVEEDDLI